MKIVLLIVAIGFGVLAFIETRKAESVSKAEAAVTEDLGIVTKKLEATERRLADIQQLADQTATQAKTSGSDVIDTKTKLTEAMVKLEETKRQAEELASGGEEMKKQLAEVATLKEKVGALETQLAAAKEETVASRAEVAKLQAAAKAPPAAPGTATRPQLPPLGTPLKH